MARPFTLRAPNRKDEAAMQKHCVTMLRAYLPNEIWWSAGLSGLRLPPHIAAEAKRMGMQRGDSDLHFVFPDGITRYAEAKTPQGVLTPEQKRVLAMVGVERFIVFRSWPELQAAVTGWMGPFGLRWLTDTESLRRLKASSVTRAA
jgi:hypothetical protein